MKNFVKGTALFGMLCLLLFSCSPIYPSVQVQPTLSATRTPRPTNTATQVTPTETATNTPTLLFPTLPLLFRAVAVDKHAFGIINYLSGEMVKTVNISPIHFTNDLGHLAWSPDGRNLVYAADRSGLYIYSMGTEKLEAVEPTFNAEEGASNGHVDWSPDNRWIAFGMYGGGNSRICLIHPDGTEYHCIFTHSTRGSSFHTTEVTSWTSDSKYILFYIFKGVYSDIWIVDVEGKNPQKLVTNYLSSKALHVAVSPDGKTIYYRSDPGTYMSPIDCYYNNDCHDIPSELADVFPDTWYKDFTPRWTGKYRTFYEKYGTPTPTVTYTPIFTTIPAGNSNESQGQ